MLAHDRSWMRKMNGMNIVPSSGDKRLSKINQTYVTESVNGLYDERSHRNEVLNSEAAIYMTTNGDSENEKI